MPVYQFKKKKIRKTQRMVCGMCGGGNGKFTFINIHNNEVLYEKVYTNGILQENGNVYRQS